MGRALRRVLSVVMLLSAMGGACAVPQGARDDCVLLRVDVQGFDDVRLMNHAGVPIGTFFSMRPKNVRLCGATYLGQYPAFNVHAIGGRYDRRVWPQGLPTMRPGMALLLVIGEHRDMLTLIRTQT